jgi:hypothetical protein
MAGRRALLAAVAGGLGALAGCGAAGSSDEPTTAPPPTETYGEPLARRGRPATICESEIKSGIRAIVDPAFGDDWAAVDPDNEYVTGEPSLGPERTVVGLVDGDRARAYPIDAFWSHEVVNDEFGGPVLVSYCPLCDSGMVASRVVDGETLTFDASGQLWVPPEIYARASEEDGDVFVADSTGTPGPDDRVRTAGNLVLYDLATESYWSQLLATGICGPHRGTELEIRPSTLATWADWRDEHPDTDVLLPPPHSGLIS